VEAVQDAPPYLGQSSAPDAHLVNVSNEVHARGGAGAGRADLEIRAGPAVANRHSGGRRLGPDG